MKTLGLALGSGGSRGVAHVGFLQALEEEEIKPDYISGCSMGAVVGACYCAGVPLSAIKERVLSLKLSQLTALNVNPIRSSGLFRFSKARKLIEAYIPPETTFADLKIPFTCVATDLIAGETVELKEGNLIDAVLASSCIPGAFSPQEIGGKLLVDGGVLERVPVREVKKLGADVVVAVDVLGDLILSRSEPPKNLIETLLRYIDVVDTRITLSKQRRRKYIDLWLEPQLGDMSQYRVKNLAFAYEKGYDLGKENAAKIKALLEGESCPSEEIAAD